MKNSFLPPALFHIVNRPFDGFVQQLPAIGDAFDEIGGD